MLRATLKKILLGAFTNRHEWIFRVLNLYLVEDGNGGTYAEWPTIKIHVSDNYPYRVLSPGLDIVSGILAYWVCCTFFFYVPLRRDVRWIKLSLRRINLPVLASTSSVEWPLIP